MYSWRPFVPCLPSPLCLCTGLWVELWPVGATCGQRLAWRSGHHWVQSRRRSVGGNLDFEQWKPHKPGQVRQRRTSKHSCETVQELMFVITADTTFLLSVSAARRGWARGYTRRWRFQWRLTKEWCAAGLIRWTTSTLVLPLLSTNRCVHGKHTNTGPKTTSLNIFPPLFHIRWCVWVHSRTASQRTTWRGWMSFKPTTTAAPQSLIKSEQLWSRVYTFIFELGNSGWQK